jgi:hypothetical protein
VIQRLLDSEDPERDAEELRPVIAGLGRQSRPVAAWLVLDGLREADEATRAAVCRVLPDCGAVEVAERAARGRVPWRRALACEFLGTIGTVRLALGRRPEWGEIPREALDEAPTALTPLTR